MSERFYLIQSYKSGKLDILRAARGESLTDALEDASEPYRLGDGSEILPGLCASLRPLGDGETIAARTDISVRLILRTEGYHSTEREIAKDARAFSAIIRRGALRAALRRIGARIGRALGGEVIAPDRVCLYCGALDGAHFRNCQLA